MIVPGRKRYTPRRRTLLLGAFLCFTLLCLVGALYRQEHPGSSRTLYSGSGSTYYIATTGSDSNDGSISSPFATLGKARSVIQTGGLTGTTVYIRGGTYPISSQFYFDSAVSGTLGESNVFANYPGETPIFTGGTATTVTAGGGEKTIDLTALGLGSSTVQQVYVNGIRQVLARTPNQVTPNMSATDPWAGSFAYASSGTPADVDTNEKCPGLSDTANRCQIEYVPGSGTGQLSDPSTWVSDVTQAKAVVSTGGDSSGTVWTSQRKSLESINTTTRMIRLAANTDYEILPHHFFYVEGLPEFLDADNEWIQEGTTLTLQLPNGAGAASVQIVTYTSGSGTDPVSNPFVVTASNFELRGLTFKYIGESYAVRVQDADNIVLNNLSVTGVDGSAILVAGSSHDVTIENSRINDVLGVGINVAQETGATFLKALSRANILIKNNNIWDIGTTARGNSSTIAGILSNRTGTTIRGNRVANSSNIAIGGGGGAYLTVDKNEITNSNLLRADTGSISLIPIWSGSNRSWIPRGHQITNNSITETGGYSWNPTNSRYEYGYYSWGVYLDDYTSNTLVQGNLIIRPHTDCIKIHAGRYNTFSNNICYTDSELGSMVQLREDHHSGYDGSQDPKWTEVQGMAGAGFDTTAYLTAFPDLADVPRYPAKGDLQVHNTISSNVLASTYSTAPKLYQITRLSPTNSFSNNTIWSSSAASLAVQGSLHNTADGFTLTWNTLADWQAAGYDSGSTFANPLFTNQSLNNYTLASNSPALTRGFTQLDQSIMGLTSIKPVISSVTPGGTLTIGDPLVSTWSRTSDASFGDLGTHAQLLSGSTSGTLIADWAATSSSTITFATTSLTPDTTYFVCVRSKNDGVEPSDGTRGEWGTTSCNSGVQLLAVTTPTPTPTPTPVDSATATATPTPTPSTNANSSGGNQASRPTSTPSKAATTKPTSTPTSSGEPTATPTAEPGSVAETPIPTPFYVEPTPVISLVGSYTDSTNRDDTLRTVTLTSMLSLLVIGGGGLFWVLRRRV